MTPEETPHFRITPLTEADARQVLGWHYDGIYAFYDEDEDEEDQGQFLDPVYREAHLVAVRDENGTLRGFFEFTVDRDCLEIGLGLRPEDTGHGLGLSFVEAGLAYAHGRFSPRRFALWVVAFNKRAIKVYGRAGFRETKREHRHLDLGPFTGKWLFIRMERPDADP